MLSGLISVSQPCQRHPGTEVTILREPLQGSKDVRVALDGNAENIVEMIPTLVFSADVRTRELFDRLPICAGQQPLRRRRGHRQIWVKEKPVHEIA